MTTNEVAKATLKDDATVYYEETGGTNTTTTTISGSEFIIESVDNTDDILIELLDNPDTVYSFKTGGYWASVARRDVLTLTKQYQGTRLPKSQ